jgi:hypothetical protein
MNNVRILIFLSGFVFSYGLAMDTDNIIQHHLDLSLLFEAVNRNGHYTDKIRQMSLNIGLYEAIGFGNIERAQELLNSKAQIGETTGALYYPETPLIRAIESNNMSMCKLLLEHRADIDERTTLSGHTPLMHAAMTGRKKACEFLLEMGADMLARDNSNNDTVLLLIAKKYTDMRKFWVKKPIGMLQPMIDPIALEHAEDLKQTTQFLIAHQRMREQSIFTMLCCLKHNALSSLRELYRQRNVLLVQYFVPYLVKPLLNAQNNEGKTLFDYN